MVGNKVAVRKAVQLAILFGGILLEALTWTSGTRAQVNPQNTPDPKDAAVQRGQQQFQQSCGFCHGADATGARGPDLLRSPLVAHDVKGNLIGEVIRNGRPDKGMPALPLTDDQVSDVAAFLHARADEAVASSHVPRVYPLEKLLTGNAAAGEAFFNGVGGCKNCHSPSSDLAKIASKYSPIDLQARMLYPEVRRPTIVAVVTLASGEQVKGRVEHVDDFVVALRDDSGWYRSFPRDRVKLELRDELEGHRALLPKLTPADVHNLFAFLETLK